MEIALGYQNGANLIRALYANTQFFCGRFRLVNLKCLGLIGSYPLSMASSLSHCMTKVFSSAYVHGFHPHCVILLFCFLSRGFWGQGFLKGNVPFSAFRRTSLMAIFQISILDCSKLSQVGGLRKILVQFI